MSNQDVDDDVDSSLKNKGPGKEQPQKGWLQSLLHWLAISQVNYNVQKEPTRRARTTAWKVPLAATLGLLQMPFIFLADFLATTTILSIVGFSMPYNYFVRRFPKHPVLSRIAGIFSSILSGLVYTAIGAVAGTFNALWNAGLSLIYAPKHAYDGFGVLDSLAIRWWRTTGSVLNTVTEISRIIYTGFYNIFGVGKPPRRIEQAFFTDIEAFTRAHKFDTKREAQDKAEMAKVQFSTRGSIPEAAKFPIRRDPSQSISQKKSVSGISKNAEYTKSVARRLSHFTGAAINLDTGNNRDTGDNTLDMQATSDPNRRVTAWSVSEQRDRGPTENRESVAENRASVSENRESVAKRPTSISAQSSREQPPPASTKREALPDSMERERKEKAQKLAQVIKAHQAQVKAQLRKPEKSALKNPLPGVVQSDTETPAPPEGPKKPQNDPQHRRG